MNISERESGTCCSVESMEKQIDVNKPTIVIDYGGQFGVSHCIRDRHLSGCIRGREYVYPAIPASVLSLATCRSLRSGMFLHNHSTSSPSE